MEPLLEVRELHVSFYTYAGEVEAVRGVSFTVKAGETVAIVGESGCGKSVTAQAIMRLISSPGEVKSGHIFFAGQDLTKVSTREIQRIRGAEIAIIFQDPMTSLNPTMTIGQQIGEGLLRHQKMNKSKAKEQIIEMLDWVGISSPAMRLQQYPHQLSGGMRQRVMIAMALACHPKLLIADEPTTALDVTIQAQILDLLQSLQKKLQTAVILVTHDLGVVAENADQVVVMYAGKVFEMGSVWELFYHPKHPYTWGLLCSMPQLNQDSDQDLLSIPGSPPELLHPPQACPFAPRCPYVMKICVEEMPSWTEISSTHQVACWLTHPDAPQVQPPIMNKGKWNHE